MCKYQRSQLEPFPFTTFLQPFLQPVRNWSKTTQQLEQTHSTAGAGAAVAREVKSTKDKASCAGWILCLHGLSGQEPATGRAPSPSGITTCVLTKVSRTAYSAARSPDRSWIAWTASKASDRNRTTTPLDDFERHANAPGQAWWAQVQMDARRGVCVSVCLPGLFPSL